MNDMSMQPVRGDILGWIVVIVGTLATIWTIAATVYWTIRPGETNPDHPKNLILKDDR
ncbi:MAG: hypothetical protein JO322_14955 [Candidatus Eremiobacteraeota bacterium]|nr:hypothetical protein [Candidatus Eremiobacteraeota bacterium]